MNNTAKNRNILSIAMLLAPFVVCLTVFIDLMINIDTYKHLSTLGVNIWTYFSITLIVAVLGFVSAAYVLVHVLILKKDIKHIRTVIITSHLGFLLEAFYIIQYVYMLGDHATALPITALVFGIVAIVGYFTSMFLHKGPNFFAYYIASAFYIIFMILMASLLGTRNNGMHIILLVFYTVSICLAGLGIFEFYFRGKKK